MLSVYGVFKRHVSIFSSQHDYAGPRLKRDLPIEPEDVRPGGCDNRSLYAVRHRQTSPGMEAEAPGSVGTSGGRAPAVPGNTPGGEVPRVPKDIRGRVLLKIRDVANSGGMWEGHSEISANASIRQLCLPAAIFLYQIPK